MTNPTEPAISDDKPEEAADGHSAGLIADVTVLTDTLRLAVAEFLQLISKETRLATRSMLVAMVVLLWMVVLLATAWIGSMAAATLLFIHVGLLPEFALLCVVALNLLLLPILQRVIRRCIHRLSYPVTRATLTSALSQMRGRSPP